jgi:hypothetical protein
MPKRKLEIPVYTASGERMPISFIDFDTAEKFQRTVIGDRSPRLLSRYAGICRDAAPDKIGRPLFLAYPGWLSLLRRRIPPFAIT